MCMIFSLTANLGSEQLLLFLWGEGDTEEQGAYEPVPKSYFRKVIKLEIEYRPF